MINEIKMDELKDLFFYTFGIVPLQNYGVFGDGMTDNRLQLQQAIYDAIEVGAKYIFVPKGNYFYSQQLFRTDEVIFIGNSVDAHIKDIEIRQFPGFNDDSSKEDEEEYDNTEYSTEERRIGTWIDGKPLYRKVFEATTKQNIDLSALNADFIILKKGLLYIKDGNDTVYIREPYYTSNNDYFRTLIVGNTLEMESNVSSIYKWITILEYTKTTD